LLFPPGNHKTFTNGDLYAVIEDFAGEEPIIIGRPHAQLHLKGGSKGPDCLEPNKGQ